MLSFTAVLAISPCHVRYSQFPSTHCLDIVFEVLCLVLVAELGVDVPIEEVLFLFVVEVRFFVAHVVVWVISVTCQVLIHVERSQCPPWPESVPYVPSLGNVLITAWEGSERTWLRWLWVQESRADVVQVNFSIREWRKPRTVQVARKYSEMSGQRFIRWRQMCYRPCSPCTLFLNTILPTNCGEPVEARHLDLGCTS